VRDIAFHPVQPVLVTCSDGTIARVLACAANSMADTPLRQTRPSMCISLELHNPSPRLTRRPKDEPAAGRSDPPSESDRSIGRSGLVQWLQCIRTNQTHVDTSTLLPGLSLGALHTECRTAGS